MSNKNYVILKDCANPLCNKQIQIKMIGDDTNKDYGQPIVKHRKKKTCSVTCQIAWQSSISWEERVGIEFATEFRQKMSILSSENNPSTFPGVADKISTSLKKYLMENPRVGEANPFYGKNHTAETIQHWKDTKSGKTSYNQEQQLKQLKNTPKKENHPNWMGGISNGEYGPGFNKSLKQFIKEDYKYTCQICKIETQILDIHHIDYNKSNNDISNLIPLCKKCHGLTNFNRDKWRNTLTEIVKNDKIKINKS
jgi:hypothetical protein